MKNDTGNKTDSDEFYSIEAILKKNGFFVFSQDGIDTQPGIEIKQEQYKPEIDTILQKQFNKDNDNLARETLVAQMERIIPLNFKRSTKIEPPPGNELEYDIPTIVNFLKWHMERVSQNIIGRRNIIEQLIYAILTGEHMLIMSRTGMAKSYLAVQVFNTFENVRVFSSQASKDQTPDNYYGPYNIEEFKRGVIRHNIKGSIIEANLVLLDEFFDASDVVLRSLLSVLNERKFINGSEQIDTAIHTAIATANYLRLNEVTEAVLDRFIYKAIIPEDNDMYNSLLIDETYAVRKGKPEEPANKIPFEQIVYLHNVIKNNNKNIQIAFPDSIKFMKNVIINKFVSEIRKTEANFYISPRKQAKMADFLRASAILDNRFEVTYQDLRNMYIGLVTINRYITIKQKEKLFEDVFIDTYEQTMAHFKATNSFQQMDFLLNVKKIFQIIKDDPSRKEKLHEDKGLIQGIRNIFSKLFPFKPKEDADIFNIGSLKKNVIELNPSVEEIRELKQGILKDYKDIN